MTNILKPGFTDTPIEGGVSPTLTAAPLNFKEDFRVLNTKPGEATITNITSPADRPEKVRFACNDVKNIYANTDVSPERYGPTKTGRSVLVQLSNVYSVEDKVSGEDLYQLPMSAHLVLRVPNSEYITDTVIIDHLERLLATLYETGKNDTLRLKALVRGSLLPRDVS